ncbi:MAG: hypothetical protein J5501_03600 [Ruminococcus sp.]|nr:hypothetical protein [Ruminococcus sp.]
MITSITADFHSSEMGSLAADRIRSRIPGVYSAVLRTHEGVAANRSGNVIPTFANNFSMNFMTAQAPGSSYLPAGGRIYIVCDGSRIDEINSQLNSLGAVNIRCNQPAL